MAIYWFSVARSLQWDEFVGRSPDFASEVVKAKTEAEGIEKMTRRILHVAGIKSDLGVRLPEPATREETAKWQESAAERNTEPGALYPVVIDIEQHEPEKKGALLGRQVKQTEIPAYWVLSRALVPDEPVPFYPESRRGMPLDKYQAMFGPALAFNPDYGCDFTRVEMLMLRAVSGDAAREAARRVRIAMEEGGACLPRVAPLLYIAGAKLRASGEDRIIEDTPAWIWQDGKPVNLVDERKNGNAWLIVEKDMCWLCGNLFNAVRQMSADRFVDGLEKLAEAMDAHAPELKEKNPDLFDGPHPDEDPHDKDREMPFPVTGHFREEAFFSKEWSAAWEEPGNEYPCLVVPYPKTIGGRTGCDLKLLFPGPKAVAEFARRIRVAKTQPDKHLHTVIDVSNLCIGRYADTGRRPVDNEPAFVETMGQWLEEGRKWSHCLIIRYIRPLIPNHSVNAIRGTFDVMLRNDGLICIFTHEFLKPKIRLERGAFLKNLEILESKLAAYGKKMGFTEE